MAYGVTTGELANQVAPVVAAPTSVIGLETITSWGPTGLPVETDSFKEWQVQWGPPTTSGFGYLWAEAAYEIAGDGLRIITHRVVHLTDVTNPASKTSAEATLTVNTPSLAATHGAVTSSNAPPFNLPPPAGDGGTVGTIVVAIDGGGLLTTTFTANAAFVESTTGTFALSNGQTITLSVNGGPTQTITFLTGEFVSIGAATTQEVVNDFNAKASGIQAVIVSNKVHLRTTRKGSSATIQVTGGTANGALGFSTSVQNGSGNVADVTAVTFAEVQTAIQAAVVTSTVLSNGGYVEIESNTTGTSSSVRVDASSTLATAMGFDTATHSGTNSGVIARFTLAAKYDGLRGDSLSANIQAASSGDPLSFNLTPLENGIQAVDQRSVWTNLSLSPTSANYFVTILNDINTGSQLFQVTDLASGNAALPALGVTANLSGGGDGLGGLTDADFNGSSLGGTGLYAFTPIEGVPGTSEISILCCPDRSTSSYHTTAINYCEVIRGGTMHFIVDLPASLTASQAITYVSSTADLLELSEYGYCVYDRIKVVNSRPDVYGAAAKTVTIPNSCVVAGAWARTDAARFGGISDPPAGKDRGAVAEVVQGLEMGQAQSDPIFQQLQSYRINTIIRTQRWPYHIRGTLTLRSTGQFPEIQERRMATFVKVSLQESYLGIMNDPLPDALTTATELTSSFLRLYTEAPARCFRSTKPSEAFSVDFGAALNPASSQLQGLGFGTVLIATKKSLQKLGIILGQNLADVQAALAAAA
jgi:uncharacterized protein